MSNPVDEAKMERTHQDTAKKNAEDLMYIPEARKNMQREDQWSDRQYR